MLTPETLTLNFSLYSERCRCTLYGHKDSVNSIEFFPCSNTLLTSSADKSLSVWDARTVSISLTAFPGFNKPGHSSYSLGSGYNL